MIKPLFLAALFHQIPSIILAGICLVLADLFDIRRADMMSQDCFIKVWIVTSVICFFATYVMAIIGEQLKD